MNAVLASLPSAGRARRGGRRFAEADDRGGGAGPANAHPVDCWACSPGLVAVGGISIIRKRRRGA